MRFEIDDSAVGDATANGNGYVYKQSARFKHPPRVSPRASPLLPGGGFRGASAVGRANGHAGYARVRSWVEEEEEEEGEENGDEDGDGEAGRHERGGGVRERLLEGSEAPSVRVAMVGEEGRERVRGGMGGAFMNMANSIM